MKYGSYVDCLVGVNANEDIRYYIASASDLISSDPELFTPVK
jgi:hypothetical protein